ncbi:MAG: response regulator [Desulfovibrio sp.]|nr:response regulator [Desulfovibrio sp.]
MKASPTSPSRRRLGLTGKAAVILTLLLLLANLMLGGALMYNSKQAIRSQVDKRMLEVATTAAAMLDGDALEQIRDASQENPHYQAVLNRLTYFQDNIDLKYIYAVRDMGNDSFSFIVDADRKDPAYFGEIVQPSSDALRSAARGKPAVEIIDKPDRWGTFFSAFAPVYNSRGKIAGIVGVDWEASMYNVEVAREAGVIVACCLASLLIGSLIVILATSRLRRRFKTTTAELAALSGGIDCLLEELALQGGQPAPREAPQDGDEIVLITDRIRALREHVQSRLRHAQTQSFSMIAALSAEYRSLYYVDLDKDEAVCYRADAAKSGWKAGETFPYGEALREHAERNVAGEFREGFLKLFEQAASEAAREDGPVLAYRYQESLRAGGSFQLVRVVRAGPRELAVGFSDVDAETKRAMEHSKILRESLMAAAEEANRAKTAFLSSMSHEFRTPMNAIIGIGDLAKDEPGISDTMRGRLGSMTGAARQLLQLLDDILDLSRIESGGITLESADFSLRELVYRISAAAEARCRSKGLEYGLEVSGILSDSVRGDGAKLEQVLASLLDNAVKFTPQGGAVRMKVEAELRFRNRPAVRFTVQDTGIGMDKCFLPKVFVPFSQEDSSSTTTQYGSTGLGLAIAKRIVDLMHGTIEAASEKDKGSVFTVTVPLGEEEAPERGGPDPDAAGVASRKDGDAGTAAFKGRRILLAEDNAINVEIVQIILEGRGFDVDVAANGKICLEKFKASPEGHYDAILMDMRMPEMDGLEATVAIRALPRADARQIPIVALSANAFSEDEARSIQAGLNAHLTKPVDPVLLFQTLGNLLLRTPQEGGKAQ